MPIWSGMRNPFVVTIALSLALAGCSDVALIDVDADHSGAGDHGDKPVTCTAIQDCETASLDPRTKECSVEALPDGTPCDGNGCQLSAACHAGRCLGVAVDCDDADPCTIDYCAAGVGCKHERQPELACGASGPCQVAACDPVAGCSIAPAPDGVSCGKRDCAGEYVCLSGQCELLPVQEGTLCVGLCGIGQCQSGACFEAATSASAPILWEVGAPVGVARGPVSLDNQANIYWRDNVGGRPSIVSVDRNGATRFRIDALGSADTVAPITLEGLVVDFGQGVVRAWSSITGLLEWEARISDAASWQSGTRAGDSVLTLVRERATDPREWQFILASLNGRGDVEWQRRITLPADNLATVGLSGDSFGNAYIGYQNLLVFDKHGDIHWTGQLEQMSAYVLRGSSTVWVSEITELRSSRIESWWTRDANTGAVLAGDLLASVGQPCSSPVIRGDFAWLMCADGGLRSIDQRTGMIVKDITIRSSCPSEETTCSPSRLRVLRPLPLSDSLILIVGRHEGNSVNWEYHQVSDEGRILRTCSIAGTDFIRAAVFSQGHLLLVGDATIRAAVVPEL